MNAVKQKRLMVGEGLELRSNSTTPLGQVINYLQTIPLNNSEMARNTLISRFLPFTLDSSHPEYRSLALACAIECESWGRAIREYCGLPSASTGVHSYPLVSSVTPVSSTPVMGESNSVVANQLPVIESDEDLLNKFKKELQGIVDSADGAYEAREKLRKMQPLQESDWTEDQWDLWDEYSSQQRSIIHRQMFGDLAKSQEIATEK
ncbi:MAG: hypothetical protein QNJ55_32825 [Xenococcus sp. MO_188.B8]|nr:hypothetical protein [Xenococcus sp. MO_188.B8]